MEALVLQPEPLTRTHTHMRTHSRLCHAHWIQLEGNSLWARFNRFKGIWVETIFARGKFPCSKLFEWNFHCWGGIFTFQASL